MDSAQERRGRRPQCCFYPHPANAEGQESSCDWTSCTLLWGPATWGLMGTGLALRISCEGPTQTCCWLHALLYKSFTFGHWTLCLYFLQVMWPA
jgi:hypothetical protein